MNLRHLSGQPLIHVIQIRAGRCVRVVTIPLFKILAFPIRLPNAQATRQAARQIEQYARVSE